MIQCSLNFSSKLLITTIIRILTLLTLIIIIIIIIIIIRKMQPLKCN